MWFLLLLHKVLETHHPPGYATVYEVRVKHARTITEPWLFLGLCIKYRWFVDDITDATEPPNNLFKMEIPTNLKPLGDPEETAFGIIIKEVTTPPVLALPNSDYHTQWTRTTETTRRDRPCSRQTPKEYVIPAGNGQDLWKYMKRGTAPYKSIVWLSYGHCKHCAHT